MREQIEKFGCLTAVGEHHADIVGSHHPEIAVQGIERIEIQGHQTDGGKGGSNLAGDDAALADPCNNQLAAD